MSILIRKSQSSISKNKIFIEGFKTDVYNVSRHIDDYEMLKHFVHDKLLFYV